MNLLPELAVGMDLVRHGNLLWRKVQVWTSSVSARHRASEDTPKGSSHLPPVWATLGATRSLCVRWRCSKAASSPLCVRVRFDFVIT